jgi:hypothetical protein
MSKRANKQVSSFSYRLQKFYERLTTSKPSLFVIAIVAVGFTLFLLGGGLYSLMNPDPTVPSSGVLTETKLYVFYPSLSIQFIFTETLLVMVFGAMGFAGFLLAYTSTKHAHNSRQAYQLLLVGCLLLLISYILIERGLLSKFGLA